MWFQFLLGCAAAGLGGGYVAVEVLRMRKREREINRLTLDLGQCVQESGQLKSQIASRDKQLQQQAGSLQALQEVMTTKGAQLGVLGERCAQLEQALRQQADEEQQRLIHGRDLQREPSLRANEREEAIASLEAKLDEQLAAIEVMQQELEARDSRIAAVTALCEELEQTLASEAQKETAREQQGLELQRTLFELEQNHANCKDELQAARATIETQQNEAATKASRLESLQAKAGDAERRIEELTRRCGKLEQELEQRAAIEQERRGQDQEVPQALSARLQELESQLAGREESLAQRAQTILRLQGETDAQGGQLLQANQRCEELEQQLRRQAVFEQDRRLRSYELQSELSSRAVELEAQLASRDEELSRLARKIDSLEGNLALSTGSVEALGQERSALEARLFGRDEELGRLAQRIDSLEGDLALSTGSVEALSQRRGELEAQIFGRDEELRRLAQVIDSLKIDLAAGVGSLEVLVRQRSELEAALKGRDGELSRFAQTIVSLQSELADNAGLAERFAEERSELEARHAGRIEDLRQSAETIDSLETDMAASAAQIDVLGRRCSEFEQTLQLETEQERERGLRDQLLLSGLSQREGELEGQLAVLEQELALRTAKLERAEREAATDGAQIDQLIGRNRELEQQQQHLLEVEAEGLRRDQELQRALSARTSELEVHVAIRDADLQQQSIAIEALRNAAIEAQQVIEASDRRCQELEQNLRRSDSQYQEQLQHEQARMAASAARALELEAELAGRGEEICRLRAEHAELADRCHAVTELTVLQGRDKEQREQRIVEINASMEVLNFAIQSCQEDARAGDALIDELAENRLAALFTRRRSAHSRRLMEQYFDGLAQGDLELALQSLLGDVEPLSAAAVERLCGRWREAHGAWKRQPIEREVAYLWAEGVYPKAGAEQPGAAVLLLVAAFIDGSSAVIAAEPGERESKQAWLALLQNLMQRGMNVPRLVVGDEALGLWDAIDELGWECAQQYCWSHRTAQVQALLPRERRSEAGRLLAAIADADSRTLARALREKFVKRCGVRRADAGERLSVGWKQMTSYYAFPREHWAHLRTTRRIDTPLGALRLCAAESMAGKPTAQVEAILWKLLSAAARTFPELDKLQLLRSLTAEGKSKAEAQADNSREQVV